MILNYKYRIFPTKSQQHILQDHLRICCLLYNKTLFYRKTIYSNTGKSVSYYDTNKELITWKQEYPEFKSVYSQVLQNVQLRVDLAFKSFFRRLNNKENAGYPRFKGKGYNSFTYPQGGYKLTDKFLWVSKIGFIKIRLHRDVPEKLKTLTLQKDNLDNWYACFSCYVKDISLPPSKDIVGIDLGLKTFATFSDGNKIIRQRWFKQATKDIVRLHRKLSNNLENNIEKIKILRAINHAYRRSTFRRDNFTHQESKKLVDKYQIIIFENLNISGMKSQHNKTINKNIGDVAWGKFIQHTMYKAERAGRSVVFIDPKNTTQQCSSCGNIVTKDLSVRVHDCPTCGLKIDRDLNAAINILARGLASFSSNRIKTPDKGE